ncbi:MAG: hypothetical protein ACRD2J_02185, partial [Thermoanaerobaculia bacterium]
PTAVLSPDAAFPDDGELWACAQAPFVYPAVTERAWVGRINLETPCEYAGYGYPGYFEGDPPSLVAPVIPAGARIEPPPFSPAASRRD